MLSHKQQEMILKMYGFWLKREVFTLNEVRKFYSSQSSFYRAINYLEESGIISYQTDKADKRRYYFLTEDGVALAKIICNLPDQDERIKRLSDLRRWDEIDMKIFGG
jgi:DNA-binding PadR family transcriptional regulator